MALKTNKERKSLVPIQFIGRDFYIEEVEKIINSVSSREYSVINFSGVGGIGKSTLLKQICYQHDNIDKNLIFYYDFDKHQSMEKFFEFTYEWLYKCAPTSIYFPIAYLIYWKKSNPRIDAKEDIPHLFKEGGLYADIFSLFVESAAPIIPIIGSASKIAYKFAKKYSTKYRLNEDMIEKINKLEEMEAEAIEAELPGFLSYDLKAYYEKNDHVKILFFFDTYETLTSNKKLGQMRADDWFEDFVINLDSRHEIFIIGGREPLLWANSQSEWTPFIFNYEINAFNTNETIKFLNNAGVEEADIIDAIISSSQGYPYYLELSLLIYSKQNARNIKDFENLNLDEIFTRFVKYLNDYSLSMLEYLSIPRFFDDTLYEKISLHFNLVFSNELYREIISYSFFKKINNQYSMHNIMRESLIKRLSKTRLILIHEFMFNYYNQQINLDTLYIDSSNEEMIFEALYHLLSLENSQLMPDWLSNISALCQRVGKYHFLADLYKKAITEIKDSSLYYKVLTELGILYIETEEYQKLDDLIEKIEKSVYIPADFIDNLEYLKACSLSNNSVRQQYAKSSESEKNNINYIKTCFERVTRISAEPKMKILAYIKLANLLRKENNFFEAKNNLFIALRLAKEKEFKAFVYDKLGYVYRDMKLLKESKKFFIESLSIKNTLYSEFHIEIAKTCRGLAHIFVLEKNFLEAKKLFVQNIKIFLNFYGEEHKATITEYKNLLRIEESEDFFIENNINHSPRLFLLYTKEAKLGNYNNKYLSKLILIGLNKVDVLLKISKILFSIDKQKCLDLLYQANEICKTKNDELKTLTQLVFYFQNINNEEQNIFYQKKLLDSAKQVSMEQYIVELQKLAAYYTKKNMFDIAQEYNLTALSSFSKRYKKPHKQAEIIKHLLYAQWKEKNWDEACKYIRMLIDFWEALEDKLEIANAMDIYHKLLIQMKQPLDAEKILYKMLEIYDQENNLHKLDGVYTKLAELHRRLNNKILVIKYYEMQLKIREKYSDLPALVRGYSFLAFEYLKNNNMIEAEAIIDKGYTLIRDHDEFIEARDLYLVYMIKFYMEIADYKKLIIAIEERVKHAEKSSHLKNLLEAYDNLHLFYNLTNNELKVESLIKKQLSLLKSSKYNIEKLKLLDRLILFYEEKNQQKMIQFKIQKIQLLLEENMFEEADSNMIILLGNQKKTDEYPKYLEHYFVNMTKYLFNASLYINYAHAITYYRLFNKENRTKFIKIQLANFGKHYDDSLIYKAIWSYLYKKEYFPEVAYYYDLYIEKKLSELKGNFYAQSQLYESMWPVLKKINNIGITQKYLEKYNRFKNRLANMNFYNNVMVSKILCEPLNEMKNFEDISSPNILKNELSHFIHIFSENQAILECMEENKMNISIFLQAMRALIPNYNPIRYGFESNEKLINWLFSSSPLCLIKLKANQSTHIIHRRQSVPDNYEILESIDDYNLYVHRAEHYAILLSECFFNGDGIFFPRNKIFMLQVYDIIVNSIHELSGVRFNEMNNIIIQKMDRTVDEKDKLRLSSLLKNLYYSGIFESDYSFKPFNEQKFILSTDPNHIMTSIKEYGKLKLEKILGTIDNKQYNMIWE